MTQFAIGDIVNIMSETDVNGISNIPTVGTVEGFRNDAFIIFVIVRLSRDVVGVYQPHELELVT